ncbi:B12-binding domain-containing radical SAM protein [Halobacteriovorax marinus]|uniref:B12-binding domain-containing radical SAM protein n=1 Tax=Halobacteriovorax marinus TaxID=97084 RepID=UPI003A951C4B
MLKGKKVLLLNPPAGDEMVIKDQYCSFTSKGNYYWIPIDLLILSGDLSRNFTIEVIDAIVEPLGEDELVCRIKTFSPDHIVILSSLLTHKIDREFIAKLKERGLTFKTTFLGDIFYFKSEVMINYDEVDSIVYEYPAPELSDYILAGQAKENMVFKDEFGEIVTTQKRGGRYVSYSTPRHELFPLRKYSVPFMIGDVVSSILTNFGCTYTCNYCPASSVEYRQRTTEEFEEELSYLKSIGVSNLWIRDFTFGLDPKATNTILEIIKRYNISWFGLTRAERINDRFLIKLRESGCYLLMIGVDTVKDSSIGSLKRKQRTDVLRGNINKVAEYKILVLVHLILGIPGETIIDMVRSIHFCASTKASFISINFFSKRSGSSYFDNESINFTNRKTLDSLYFENGDKGSCLLVFLNLYALFIFYLRPLRILRILSNVKTRRLLVNILKTGFLHILKLVRINRKISQ